MCNREGLATSLRVADLLYRFKLHNAIAVHLTWIKNQEIALFYFSRKAIAVLLLALCDRCTIGFNQKILKNMPQELTPEQRLTQIEKLLESAIKLSHSNTAKIDTNSEMIERIGRQMIDCN